MTQTQQERVRLLASLSPEDTAALAAAARPIAYPARTVLFREGDHGDRLYVVLEGQIEIVKALDTKDERPLGLRGPGEFLGEMSFLSVDGLRSASARVHADALLLELDRGEFDRLLERRPALVYEMLRVMSAQLRDANDLTIRDLRKKNEQLSQAYAALQAAQAQLIEKERLQHELRLAREIQESMLPRAMPRMAGAECSARMIPALEVGGDFFDVFAIDDDTLGIAIGDVCGKGMPSALYMAQARSLIRAEADRAVAPAEVLRMVNRHLLEMSGGGMFVTVVYAQLSCSTRTLVFARAGHEHPLLWSADGAEIACGRGAGHPLGLLPNPAIDVQTLALPAGATLLLYTDGVTEAASPAGELFGSERLRAAVPGAQAATPQQLCDALVLAIDAHRGGAPQSDDITLLALRAP